MSLFSAIRAGFRIKARKPKTLMTPTQMDQVISVCNAFLNLKVTRRGSKPGIIITNDNSTLDLGLGAGGAGGIELRTDGELNPVQTLLNLISGDGVTLTVDDQGGVTIDATGGSDIWL